MDGWLQAAIILGMFLLRLVVPLAIVLGVGYLLQRLDAKWQAEAQAHWQMAQAQPSPAALNLLGRLNQPCWLIKGCDEATCARCPAAQQPHLPCWLARRTADGRLPEACYTCERLLYGQLGYSLTRS
jgi:hypothetical protein